MEFWTAAWKFGWADMTTMQEAVQVGCISSADYKTITGTNYAAPAE